MIPAKNILVAILFPVLACLIISSCAALDLFKGSAGTSEGQETVVTTKDSEPSQALPDTASDQTSEQTIEQLESKISKLEDKVSSLEGQVASQKKVVYTMEYSDPAQLYQKARNLLLENEVDNAADLFATFAKQHPEHSLADNALYWLGECHYTKGRYDKAIEVFKALVQSYPKAEKVPDALLKTGYAYLSIDDVNRASHFLKLVIKKYPFTPAAEKAQKKLSTFQ